MAEKNNAATGARNPIRVLLIEDMELEAELTVRHLQKHGIVPVVQRVETDEGMRAALREFKPTIILSDFSLPTFDGLRALDIARECAPEVPFLFVSGTIGEERAIEALRRGAVDYVLKSNLARLGSAVQRALQEAEADMVRRRQERQIGRLTGVLRMLSGINGAVVRIRDRTELLREACRLSVAFGGYPAAVVGLQQPKSQRFEPVAHQGADPLVAHTLCELLESRMAQDDQARARGRDPAAPFTCQDAGATHTAVIGLPLLVDKTVVGVLGVCPREHGTMPEEELVMLREVAANLSFGLQYLRQDSRVRLLSYFDVLTGLAKRALFCERLGKILRESGQSRRFGTRHAIAVFDVQNLSAINDSFGRHSGDQLLQLLADRLKRRFENTEFLAHFAGGTFALVQEMDRSRMPDMEALNAQLDQLFTEPFSLQGKDVPVAARSGIALHPEDGSDPDTLVNRAEASLRGVKESGQRRGHYSAEKHAEALARVALERKLRVALEREQFELYYQPKMSVKTRRIEGAEALIRWNDPDSGLVSPAKFLPVLEESGLILDVGDWVIQRAALDCMQWQQQGLPAVRIAVNISPLQLRQPDFVTRFLKHIQSWTTMSCGLDAEITEGALISDSSAAISKLKLLRAAGIKIAIDDFGTGYSSLSRLAHLPIDTLKIDRSFINEMTADARGKRLVSIIISIARAFNLVVVAEGVESQEQLDTLWQLGCDQSQGYLHSKPLPVQQFCALLQANSSPHIESVESSGRAGAG
ncbi:MAG TPA: EAL domain-containing protein [Steroidobacteraceae bacterium]|jgi:diguanylate cyclase (GGDEF)-like protein|nr:EAL domain-containing protein [Steroidobacteraceae bacterium]